MSGALGDILRFYTIPRRNVFFITFVFSFHVNFLKRFISYSLDYVRVPLKLVFILCRVYYESFVCLRGCLSGTLGSWVAGFVAFFLFCCRRCSGSYPAGKSPLGGCGVGKPERVWAELVEQPSHRVARHEPRPPPQPRLRPRHRLLSIPEHPLTAPGISYEHK